MRIIKFASFFHLFLILTFNIYAGNQAETIKSFTYENNNMHWNSLRLGMTIKELENILGASAFQGGLEPFCGGPASYLMYKGYLVNLNYSGRDENAIVKSISVSFNNSFTGNTAPPPWTRERSISLLKAQFPGLEYYPWLGAKDPGEDKTRSPLYVLAQNEQIIVGIGNGHISLYSRSCFKGASD